MNAKLISFSRTAGLLAGGLLAACVASAQSSPNSDALPTFDNNYIKVSGAVPTLSGSHAAFQQRTQTAKQGFGGIEELSYGYDLSKATSLQVDGRALAGEGDYLAQFTLTKNEVGSFGAGYKRTRTFYDGAGGFFPLNNQWLPIYPRALFVDRGKFFVNGALTLPKAPVITFSYTNETRTGRKDSTIWGDTDLTGVPIYSLGSLNPVSANRKIVPAYLQLGERQETWTLGAQHTVGNTTANFSVIANRINNLDFRSVDRYPGELKPFPAIPSNPPTLVPANLANNQNKGFDQQGFKENGLTFTGKLETVFSERITGFVNASYRLSHADITGSRLISATIPTLVGAQTAVGAWTSGGRPPYSYTSIGGLKLNDYIVTAGVRTTPFKDFELETALKLEDFRTVGDNTAIYVNNLVNQTTGVIANQPLIAPNSSRIKEKPWTPEIDARYTGFQDVVLFADWDYRSSPGDRRVSNISVSPSGSLILPGLTEDFEKVREKYVNAKLGVEWVPSSLVTMRGEVFSKNHDNNYPGYGEALGEYFILNYDTYGARGTLTVRPLSTLSLATRYTLQRGKAQVSQDGFLVGDSSDARRYQFSETIDWNPTKLFYAQLEANVVWDKTNTAYPRAGGSASDVLHNADNNYWNGSVVAGFVIDKETDAQIQGTYYKTNNYHPSLATATVPYGASGRDYSCTVGLKHKFSDRAVGSAKIGYFNSDNVTAGGFANFKGTVGYLSLTYRL